MGNILIRTHDFEEAKKGLKDFSEQAPMDPELQRVKDRKGFGEWLKEAVLGGGIGREHNVTGEELNTLTSQLQKHLISINDMNYSFIKEIGRVYVALEALDRDYIQAILVSIKATEETSNQLAGAQEKIRKIVEDQRKTLEILKKHKTKLDAYAHLGDIDRIWRDCQKWQTDEIVLSKAIATATSAGKANGEKIEGLSAAIKSLGERALSLETLLKEYSNQLERVYGFMCDLKKMTHLNDIDEMWDSVSEAHVRLLALEDALCSVKETVINHQTEIEMLSGFVRELSKQAHLHDIDEMWSKVDMHDTRLGELEEQDRRALMMIDENAAHINALRSKTDGHDVMLGRLEEQDRRAHMMINENAAHINALRRRTDGHEAMLSRLEEQDRCARRMIGENAAHINALETYRRELDTVVHLREVDRIWNATEAHTAQISDLVKERQEMYALILNHRRIVEAAMEKAEKDRQLTAQSLKKKIKYAYWIGGGSAGLALIELLLIIFG